MLSLTNCTDEELLADLRASLPIEHYRRVEAWHDRVQTLTKALDEADHKLWNS